MPGGGASPVQGKAIERSIAGRSGNLRGREAKRGSGGWHRTTIDARTQAEIHGRQARTCIRTYAEAAHKTVILHFRLPGLSADGGIEGLLRTLRVLGEQVEKEKSRE